MVETITKCDLQLISIMLVGKHYPGVNSSESGRKDVIPEALELAGVRVKSGVGGWLTLSMPSVCARASWVHAVGCLSSSHSLNLHMNPQDRCSNRRVGQIKRLRCI